MKASYLFLVLIAGLLVGCGNIDGPTTAGDPSKKADNQIMNAGPLQMIIDPSNGGRIVSFSYEGKDILTTKSGKRIAQFGSSAAVSAPIHWTSNPLDFEYTAYEYALTAENRMHFYSPVDTASKLHLIKSIRLAVDEVKGPLATIRYQIYNRGTDTVKLSLAENSYLPFEGQLRIPEKGAFRSEGAELPTVEAADGTKLIVLNEQQPKGETLFCDLAKPTKKYLFSTYENKDLVLLKRWECPKVIAPNNSRLSIGLKTKEACVNQQIQGEYQEIPPKKFVELRIFWHLLPKDQLERELVKLR